MSSESARIFAFFPRVSKPSSRREGRRGREKRGSTGCENAPEDRDETVDITLVVVDVRADAQAAEPRRRVDILRG
jgi:hypothetical protein